MWFSEKWSETSRMNRRVHLKDLALVICFFSKYFQLLELIPSGLRFYGLMVKISFYLYKKVANIIIYSFLSKSDL